VTRDLAGLDTRPAYFLSPRDVCAAERVRPQAPEITALRNRGPMKFASHSGIPHRLSGVVRLRKDPRIGILTIKPRDPFQVSARQPPKG
jgi:hypothetical protein